MAKIFDFLLTKKRKNLSKMWSDIEPILAPYKRTAWMPVTKKRQSSCRSSKFSGVPVLSGVEDWPCCQHCHQPMQLFLQLNSEHLPKESNKPFGDGFLQVFYCTNEDTECEVACEAYFPFSNSTLVRVITLSTESSSNEIRSPVKDAFPEKEITGWLAKDDFPNWEELEEQGVILSEEQSTLLYEQKYPLSKDKLLGWPNWIQGVEYPDCPTCGNRMELIFQIDSEDNLPNMFGDAGCSHITQCKEHKEQLTIAWACS